MSSGSPGSAEPVLQDVKGPPYYLGVGLCVLAGLSGALANILATKLNRKISCKDKLLGVGLYKDPCYIEEE